MLRRNSLSILVACALPHWGCDLVESASATIVVSGLVIKSPELKVAGRFDVPTETAATVWVGERRNATDTSEPTPISDAQVAVTFAGNRVAIPADPDNDGLYLQMSSKDSALMYAAGAPYTFEAKRSGDITAYGGTVTMAPTELTPAAMRLTPEPTTSAPGLPEVGLHAKNAGLRLEWGEQFGTHAFVTVVRADAAKPDDPQLVFDNRPETAQEILQFVAGTPPTSIEIPGETFAVDGVYAVVLVVLEKGEPNPSTFLGSPLLVGTGAARFLAVGL
ncbi:MAG: hypothetical protein IPG45_09700 [Deltaproteobacteria bacterium]|jgi:hypothetical protein|nr:hypothetical protein [Deltaproteobacteria bacterium]